MFCFFAERTSKSPLCVLQIEGLPGPGKLYISLFWDGCPSGFLYSIEMNRIYETSELWSSVLNRLSKLVNCQSLEYLLAF